MKKKRNIYWIAKERTERQKRNEQFYINRERNQRFYHSPEWLAVRLFVLNTNPICTVCNDEIATEVHHTLNVNEHWDERLNVDYLQSICRSCHQKETVKEQTARKKGKEIKSIEDTMNELDNWE